MTALFAVGCLVAIASRSRTSLLALGLFVLWLVAWFGRPTLGALTNIFPLDDGLLFHRFIGGVDLAAIVVMGLGGALVWGLWRPHRGRLGPVGAVIVINLILVPAYMERADFYAGNQAMMKQTHDAVVADRDGKAILTTLKSLPSARIFAGLPATYGAGPEMRDGSVHFYNLLTFEGLDGFAPPNQSLSLTSDYIWDFRDTEQADYELYNARYVVAPTGKEMAPFLTPIQRTAAIHLV